MVVEGRVRALLVEDDLGYTRLVQLALEGEPSGRFTLLHVERLKEALNRIKVGPVEVILLDLGLPDSQGLETLKTLRKRAPHVPVVVLTALDDREMVLDALECGASDYLVKGTYNREILIRTIEQAIERARRPPAEGAAGGSPHAESRD
ncbi:MAG: response regulator [Euryarchaeota archaeon]|nr:response regulator [Euryarchaeota archaeon]MDE1835513.1 response regulator [Euryarchaeota archaeon]MDE1879604.1 response regulator [Euryarchaeota archaeon]MDE2043865.1 response regulator [Thermoplasmata archaeon]